MAATRVRTKKKKKWVIVLVIIILLAAIAAVLFASGVLNTTSRQERDREALAGQLPGRSAEEIEEILNTQVEEGMLNISINPTPMFENGTASGNLNIENIPGNHYSVQVTITRDDTGGVIYNSKLIDPGYYIGDAALDVSLAKGSYDCTAVFTAIDPETEDEMGTAAAKLKITIVN